MAGDFLAKLQDLIGPLDAGQQARAQEVYARRQAEVTIPVDLSAPDASFKGYGANTKQRGNPQGVAVAPAQPNEPLPAEQDLPAGWNDPQSPGWSDRQSVRYRAMINMQGVRVDGPAAGPAQPSAPMAKPAAPNAAPGAEQRPIDPSIGTAPTLTAPLGGTDDATSPNNPLNVLKRFFDKQQTRSQDIESQNQPSGSNVQIPLDNPAFTAPDSKENADARMQYAEQKRMQAQVNAGDTGETVKGTVAYYPSDQEWAQIRSDRRGEWIKAHDFLAEIGAREGVNVGGALDKALATAKSAGDQQYAATADFVNYAKAHPGDALAQQALGALSMVSGYDALQDYNRATAEQMANVRAGKPMDWGLEAERVNALVGAFGGTAMVAGAAHLAEAGGAKAVALATGAGAEAAAGGDMAKAMRLAWGDKLSSDVGRKEIYDDYLQWKQGKLQAQPDEVQAFQGYQKLLEGHAEGELASLRRDIELNLVTPEQADAEARGILTHVYGEPYVKAMPADQLRGIREGKLPLENYDPGKMSPEELKRIEGAAPQDMSGALVPGEVVPKPAGADAPLDQMNKDIRQFIKEPPPEALPHAPGIEKPLAGQAPGAMQSVPAAPDVRPLIEKINALPLNPVRYDGVQMAPGLDVDKVFKAQGFKPAGAGAFARVYVNKGQGVAAKYMGNDEGYLRFLDVIKGDPSPHFPKIYGVHDLNGGGKVVLTEALMPLKLMDQAKLTDASDYFMAQTAGAQKLAEAKGAKLAPDLKAALDKLVEGIKDKRAVGDLHMGNIMKRKDGTPVITDPYAGDFFPAKGLDPREIGLKTGAAFLGAIAPFIKLDPVSDEEWEKADLGA